MEKLLKILENFSALKMSKRIEDKVNTAAIQPANTSWVNTRVKESDESPFPHDTSYLEGGVNPREKIYVKS